MIETARSILRPWRESDIAPFHARSRDAEVMRYLGPLMSLDQARAAHDRRELGDRGVDAEAMPRPRALPCTNA